MREFNIFGPVNPREHYHVNRVATKAAMRAKIEKGRYFTLNAGRQTGKTTLFREVVAELEQTSDYFGILLDFELLTDFPSDQVYERLGRVLEGWRFTWPAAPVPSPMRHQGDFADWLRATAQALGRRGVLIIDEFDAWPPELLRPLLMQFRGMYLERNNPNYHALQSVVLVGVRNIPSLLEGTQSPFNIADQFTVPYFTPDEVTDLLTQHTQETGQLFEPAVMHAIHRESAGQPFLVNRLAQILTQDLVPDPQQPITQVVLTRALALLLTEDNTHFASIVSKATPHRARLWRALFYNEDLHDFLDPAARELIMYGVLSVVPERDNVRVARVANPIYRKMLLLRFKPPPTELPLNGSFRERFIINGLLDFDGLLDSFAQFMRAHGVRLLKSEATGRPLEISGQYLLLSYLTAAFNGLGGHVTIESLSSAGEMDLLVFYHQDRFIVETKVWYGSASFERGKQQLVDYLRAMNLPKGYMVIFDLQRDAHPLLTEHGEVFELTIDDKHLRVYLVMVET